MSKELGVKGLIRYRVAQEHEKYAHKSYAEKDYWIDAIVDKLGEDLEALIAEREQKLLKMVEVEVIGTEENYKPQKQYALGSGNVVVGVRHEMREQQLKALAELKGERS